MQDSCLRAKTTLNNAFIKHYINGNKKIINSKVKSGHAYHTFMLLQSYLMVWICMCENMPKETHTMKQPYQSLQVTTETKIPINMLVQLS